MQEKTLFLPEICGARELALRRYRCNRDLYPDYGNGKGQPSNEQHSRPTLNIVNISIVSVSRKGMGATIK